MAFFIASVPSGKGIWITILVGLTIAACVLFFADKLGYAQELEKLYDNLFWIMFYFWWSIWAYIGLSWGGSKLLKFVKFMARKIKKLVQKKKEPAISYSYNVNKFKNGNSEDLNPAWLMQ
jgi:hypothetical protein